ncbi:MAG: uracil phosphoribosyltransferase [Chitinophagaceae bacterium]
MVINLSEHYSILCDWIAEIRDAEVQKDPLRFRHNMERIGEIAAYEISRQLAYSAKVITTPLGKAPCKILLKQPVLATILRAGIPLHTGLNRFFDRAGHAFAGAFREHKPDGSFDINLGYLSCPPLEGRHLILADPMLATGASLVKTLDHLLKYGVPDRIDVVTVIAATDGIRKVQQAYPEISIWAGDVDSQLNEKGYIIPGLGDAGDLAYGSKKQQ